MALCGLKVRWAESIFDLQTSPGVVNWEFPQIRGTLFWGPYNKDPTICGTILRSRIFGNPHLGLIACRAQGSLDLVI